MASVLRAFIALFFVLTACSSNETGLVADLRTDYVAGLEVVRVTTSVVQVGATGPALLETADVPAGADLLAGYRIANFDLPPGTWEATVTLEAARGADLAGRRVIVDIPEGSRIGATLVVTRNCESVVCADDQTCQDGMCVDPRCSPETPSACPAPVCTADSECTAMGAACVVGRCRDGVCFSAADDALCGGGELCDPVAGCVPVGVDVGPMDSGVDAMDSDVADADDAGTDGGGGDEPLTGVTDLVAGFGHACAVAGGELFCWGRNARGQLGDGTMGADRPLATRTTGTFPGAVLGLAAGREHTCAAFANEVYCWGDNVNRQTNNSSSDLILTPSPQAIPSAPLTAPIGAGDRHTCATAASCPTDCEVFCWGSDGFGQIGVGMGMTGRNQGPAVSVGSTFIAGAPIAGGSRHTCSADSAGGAGFCWGDNDDGQHGSGSTDFVDTPNLSGAGNLTHLAAGDAHTCGIDTSGFVSCWGNNDSGQVGEPSAMTPVVIPVMAPMPTATDIAAGRAHTCAADTGGAVHCWGTGDAIGDVGVSSAPSPAGVRDVSNVVRVVAGDSFTCALTMSGGVLCWGDNSFGQLGDGTVGGSRTAARPVLR